MTLATPSATSAKQPAVRNSLSGSGRLIACLLSLAAVWLGILPWLAARPEIDARIRWLDEQGIDPSAMYYTELEAMKPILQKVNDRLRREDRADRR